MIEAAATAAGAAGATCTRRPGSALDPRAVRVEIVGARGLAVGILIAPRPRNSPYPDSWVLSWHLSAFDRVTKLRADFGNVNPHHFGKATHIADSFAELLTKIGHGLTLARSGEAFQ